MKRRSKQQAARPAIMLTPREEPAAGHCRRRVLLAATGLASLIALGIRPAMAGPDGASVAAGAATVTNPTALSTLITQTTGKAIINWRGFSSAANESIVFQQPNAASITLNRVTGGQASTLLGALSANGQVWLVNPSGVFFGQGATVNVGGLLATTSDIRDQDFLDGIYSFGIASSDPSARIVNLGTIEAAEGGTVVLSAASVENGGVIKARLGSVVLGGAKTFTVDFVGDGLLSYAIGEGVGQGSGVKNTGTIAADGGTVLVTAKAASNITGALINTTGLIQANSVSERNGTIILDAGNGELVVDGRLSAIGDDAGETGGTIKALGGTTIIADGAVLDASGQAGGGFVETSGHRLSIGLATIRARKWLLDPYDLTIDSSAAATISNTLNMSDNTEILVQTTADGATAGSGSANPAGNGDIFVNADISWSTSASLTLDAYRDIYVNAVISHAGSAGSLSLVYGDTTSTLGEPGESSSSGTYHIGSSGRVALQAGDGLSIGGNSDYVVVSDWSSLLAINDCPACSFAIGGTIDVTNQSGQLSLAADTVLAGLGNTITGTSAEGRSGSGLISAGNLGTIRDLRLSDAGTGTTAVAASPLASPAATQALTALIASPSTPVSSGLGGFGGGLAAPPFVPAPSPAGFGTLGGPEPAGTGGGLLQTVGGIDGGRALFGEISPESNAGGGVDRTLAVMADPLPVTPAPNNQPPPPQTQTPLVPGLAQSTLGTAPPPPASGAPGITGQFSISGNSGRW